MAAEVEARMAQRRNSADISKTTPKSVSKNPTSGSAAAPSHNPFADAPAAAIAPSNPFLALDAESNTESGRWGNRSGGFIGWRVDWEFLAVNGG